MMSARRLVSLTIGGLLCAAFLEAQTLTGTMLGVVRDDSGGVLPGVTATVTSPAMPAGPMSVTTTEQGQYRFTDLRPGEYELTVTLEGFKTYVERGLRVTVGGTIERDVKLGAGDIALTVTVSGAGPVVDTRQTGIATALPSKLVEAIPQNRQGGAQAYMAMVPGVVAADNSMVGSVSVLGSPATGTSYMTDGILTNDPGGGAYYAFLDPDVIEEMQVVTLGASVEYQQAEGGLMNIVTKAGTNRWRGDGMWYFAPKSWTSAPIKLPCNCAEEVTGFRLYKYRDFAFHGGGPIIKNRLWYFGGVSNAGPGYSNPGVEEPPDEYKFTRDEYRSNHKWTFKVNDSITINQTFYYEWWRWLGAAVPDYPTPFKPLEAIVNYTGGLWGNASELTAALSNSTLLTARYTINADPSSWIGFGPNLQHNAESLLTPARYDNATGVQTGNYFPAYTFNPRRDEASVKINRFIDGARATHNLRFGVQVVRTVAPYAEVYPGGRVFYDFDGSPDYVHVREPSSASGQVNALGVWFEDEWTFGRITIVPGVRFDRMRMSSPDADAIDPTVLNEKGGLCRCVATFGETGRTVAGLGTLFTWNKVSPRIGANIRLTSDNKTILRATAGRYYRPAFPNEFNQGHPGIATGRDMYFDPATGDYTIPGDIYDPRADWELDPDIQAPSTDQFSVGIDREVVNNLGISATLVHKESRNQIGWVDVGGQYGETTVIDPRGNPLTVFPLLNDLTDRRFLRTNPSPYFQRYTGLVLAMSRRFANGWAANVGYTLSKNEGLTPSSISLSAGRDPNDLINASGLDIFDRRHLFQASGSYEIPRIDVQVSGNLTLTQGSPYGAQMRVPLPQGTRSVFFEAPGAYRLPNQSWLHLRAQKILFRDGPRRLEVGVELRNALDETSIDQVLSQVFTADTFGLQGQYPIPRQLMFRVRGYF